MPESVLYPLALLGALTLLACAAFLLLVLLDDRGRRATHRRVRRADSTHDLTPVA